MKKIYLIGLTVLLLLTGCAPKFDKQEEVVQKTDDAKEKAIIPKYQISEQYYRTILPFEPSQARGLVVSNLNTRFDVNEMEMGLMRIAQQTFEPDTFLFKEGQYLDSKTVNKWLNRKFTKEQLAKEKIKESNNIGLNPLNPGKGDIAKQNEQNPIYLSHILEQDYMVKNGEGTVGLGGVVIGLALNSVHYYQKEEFGDVYSVKIPTDEMEKQGKKIAQEVLLRLRKMDDLKNVPITIALFKQEASTSVVPGNFIAYTNIGEGVTSIRDWEKVNEKYLLFPSEEAKDKHRDDVTFFLNFKQDVEKYFPNFNGVVGRGYYVDDQLQELNITIPIQFYGKAEAIGFTQYVAGLVMEHFPEYVSVQVAVNSVSGPESLIVRKPNQKEPFVHIYQY
ncbi:CamS family sex pheromone protein [Peribacillus alkalitolerans]|uniref:CamS family sex pheromone protein n=1 Tax=Peribacillus alkalitolerans TaxID=1550385 RepID=UPI0013D5AC13|nr:CamS family sex pheromone protein [Peribacillus alkalitolerans]